MELTRFVLCLVFAFILFTDVIVARPKHLKGDDLEAVIRDIDNRLIASTKSSHRRRRRNVMTHNIAIMDYCLQYPNACRRHMENLRRRRQQQNGGRARSVIYIIDK